MTTNISDTKVMTPLRPDECVQKILISTPSRFVGELDAENILITHAWQGAEKKNSAVRYDEGPASRSAYVLIFRTEPFERRMGAMFPNYSGVGPLICSYLSVLFGKRFDNHGLVEGTGHFYVPDQSQYLTLTNHRLPHNSHQPRKNLEIPLDLSEAKVILPLLFGNEAHPDVVHTFHTAALFYMQAIQNRDDNPEISYLHLITSMEIVAGFYQFDDSELIDEQMSKYLVRIETEMSGGQEVAQAIRGRMFSIRRRVLLTMQRLLDSAFYEVNEARHDFGALKFTERDSCIKAAYDLRSKYVHTGVPFGGWMISGFSDEVQIGKPLVEGKEYAKILEKAPTFLGLERMVRYCLLRFLHLNDIPIHAGLGNSSFQI